MTAAPLRVLHIAESFSSGVASAIEAFIEAQPEGTVASAYGYRIPGVQIEDQVGLPIPFVDLPAGKLKQLRAIRSIVARERPDVVHLHSSWAGLFGRLVPVPRSTRIVFTPHCWGFQRLDLSRSARRAILTIEKLLGRRTDVVLACSVQEANLARTHGLAKKVLHLQQQLPTQLRQIIADQPPRTQPSAPPLLAGMNGRICPQKGPDFFLAVADRLRVEGGDQTVQLRWIGGGPPDDEAELKAAGVEVTGWITQFEAVQSLAECDIYLHTAAWEGYPMTILEAFEFDLPVVARSIPALVAEPRGVYLVENPVDAVNALHRIAADWPAAAAEQETESLEERRRLVGEAYGSQSTSTSSGGPGVPG